MKRVDLRSLRCGLRGERYFDEMESPPAVRTTGAGLGFHAGFLADGFAAASAPANASASASAARRSRRGTEPRGGGSVSGRTRRPASEAL